MFPQLQGTHRVPALPSPPRPPCHPATALAADPTGGRPTPLAPASARNLRSYDVLSSEPKKNGLEETQTNRPKHCLKLEKSEKDKKQVWKGVQVSKRLGAISVIFLRFCSERCSVVEAALSQGTSAQIKDLEPRQL